MPLKVTGLLLVAVTACGPGASSNAGRSATTMPASGTSTAAATGSVTAIEAINTANVLSAALTAAELTLFAGKPYDFAAAKVPCGAAGSFMVMGVKGAVEGVAQTQDLIMRFDACELADPRTSANRYILTGGLVWRRWFTEGKQTASTFRSKGLVVQAFGGTAPKACPLNARRDVATESIGGIWCGTVFTQAGFPGPPYPKDTETLDDVDALVAKLEPAPVAN